MLPVNRRNQNWLPSILNEFFDDNFMAQPYFNNRDIASPAMNITESDNQFEIELATPGMSKEDFSVTLENDNELVISLEKKQEAKNEDNKENEPKQHKKYHCHEFSYQSFRQSFNLAENIDLEKISAKMENGILTITLPKKEVVQNVPVSRQINIC